MICHHMAKRQMPDIPVNSNNHDYIQFRAHQIQVFRETSSELRIISIFSYFTEQCIFHFQNGFDYTSIVSYIGVILWISSFF